VQMIPATERINAAHDRLGFGDLGAA